MLTNVPRVSATVFREMAIINLDDSPIMYAELNVSNAIGQFWTAGHLIVGIKSPPMMPSDACYEIASNKYGYLESIIEDVEAVVLRFGL